MNKQIPDFPCKEMCLLLMTTCAGAATSDIITQYVHTIKTLREVDPTGMLLEEVSDPIREYLRGRKDTIRCIVTALTDDAGGTVAGESLFDELQRPANDEASQRQSV